MSSFPLETTQAHTFTAYVRKTGAVSPIFTLIAAVFLPKSKDKLFLLTEQLATVIKYSLNGTIKVQCVGFRARNMADTVTEALLAL